MRGLLTVRGLLAERTADSEKTAARDRIADREDCSRPGFWSWEGAALGQEGGMIFTIFTTMLVASLHYSE